jgi:hypothetical protein
MFRLKVEEDFILQGTANSKNQDPRTNETANKKRKTAPILEPLCLFEL